MKQAYDKLASFLQTPMGTLVVYVLATAIVLGRGLFSSGDLVLSSVNTDLATEFVYWRQFAFEQLRHGHLPLWNPYVFSGTPFLGGWQSGLLYLPNLIYLFLPLAKAINLEIAISVVWVGFGVATWSRYHDVHPVASLTAGFVAMFGGAFFLHIYAGHLATLDSMAWIPWILLAADQLIDRVNLRSYLLLTWSLAMAVLGGHPQTLFYGLVTLVIYMVLTARYAKDKLKSATALVGAGVFAASLVAVQICAGLAASSEGTRKGGVTYQFASMFSFPPENIITVICPWFLGDTHLYWGRCYVWEMCLFTGCIAAIAAVYAVFRVKHQRKVVWAILAVVLFILASGSHEPLFPLLFHFVPGFNQFRSNSKFEYDASLFVAMLSALGLDELIRTPHKHVRLAKIVGTIGVVVIVAALAIDYAFPQSFWFGILQSINQTGESYLPMSAITDVSVAQLTKAEAVQSLVLTGLTFLACASFLWFAPRKKILIYALPLLAIVELGYFALHSTAYFNLSQTVPPYAANAQTIGSEGNRILQIPMQYSNSGMVEGVSDIWGYDPTVLERYAQFMNITQNLSGDEVDMYLNFKWYNPIYRVLRCTDVIVPGPNNSLQDARYPSPVAHAFFVRNVIVTPERDALFRISGQRGFNPRTTALLEKSLPFLHASGLNSGTATVTPLSTDQLAITTDSSGSGLLVISDNYSRYWTASVDRGNFGQDKFTVVPVDYTLIGIPLSAGHHVFTLQYIPKFYGLSIWISVISVLLYLIAALFSFKKAVVGKSQAG